VSSAGLAEARDRFVLERPKYVALVDSQLPRLRAEMRRIGVECEVTGRAKDVASFVTKAFRKQYTDSWTQTTDKAGLRITTFYERDIDAAVARVLAMYPDGATIEDKRSELDVAELGYLGVHVTATVRGDGDEPLTCEIQVRTAAQSSWAVMSHHLLYKPDLQLPVPVRRALYRLLALVELFDSEVERAMKEFSELPAHALAMVRGAAERAYYEFAVDEYDQQLTLTVLDALRSAFHDAELAGYAVQLEEFVDANRERIADRLARYRGLTAHPVLSQPEALVLFERLQHAPVALEEAWLAAFPLDVLDDVRAAWGYDLTM
jgi:ppGpp synthetase/RelA/SpoT-type nucleotidyltranferase